MDRISTFSFSSDLLRGPVVDSRATPLVCGVKIGLDLAALMAKDIEREEATGLMSKRKALAPCVECGAFEVRD